MKIITINNHPISFNDVGSGPTIVLLHGFMESLKIWEDFSRQFSKSFRVVSIDLPGHGETPVMEEVHSMEFMAKTVKHVLDELNISKCVMVGHSMGGYVTLQFAKQFPELLAGFCLFHSQAGADNDQAKENRRRTINIVKLNKVGFIQQFIPELFSPSNIDRFRGEIKVLQQQASTISAEGIIAALEGMKVRAGSLNLLATTNLPVLFIAGKEDSKIPIQTIMAQALLPAHAEVLILGEVGHMGFYEAKKETLGIVEGFAKRAMKTEKT